MRVQIKINGESIGIAGKSAYQAAKEAGYQGSESEFNSMMASIANAASKEYVDDALADLTFAAEDVGAVPVTRTVNGKALSADVTLNAADVGARAASWMPTAADVGALPVQYAPKKFTISLEASGWQSNQKTITVEGITTGNIVLLSPASKADADTWTAAGVWCTGQGANSLTFSCESVPSSAIGLNLMILEAAT